MLHTRGNTMFAFLLGGAVGAGLALLYAPASGAETRRKIRDGVEDAGDWTKDTFYGAKNRVEEGAGRVKQLIVDKRDDLKAAVEAGKEAFHKGKERLLKEA